MPFWGVVVANLVKLKLSKLDVLTVNVYCFPSYTLRTTMALSYDRQKQDISEHMLVCQYIPSPGWLP